MQAGKILIHIIEGKKSVLKFYFTPGGIVITKKTSINVGKDVKKAGRHRASEDVS